MNSHLVLFLFGIIFNTLTIQSCRGENITLRGTMINPNLNEEDFRVLASWNANLIRW